MMPNVLDSRRAHSVAMERLDLPTQPGEGYSRSMKSAPPSVVVDPALLDAAAPLVEPDESLGAFVDHAVQAEVERRRAARERFLADAQASLEEAKRTGRFIPAEVVLRELEAKLEDVKRRFAERGR
jgi:hypothetical protein